MNCLGKDTAEWESEYFKWVVSREAVCHLCYSLLESELFSFGEWIILFWRVRHYHLLPEQCIHLSCRSGCFFLDACMRDAEEGILLFLSLCMIVPGDCILTFELLLQKWVDQVKAVLLGWLSPHYKLCDWDEGSMLVMVDESWWSDTDRAD